MQMDDRMGKTMGRTEELNAGPEREKNVMKGKDILISRQSRGAWFRDRNERRERE